MGPLLEVVIIPSLRNGRTVTCAELNPLSTNPTKWSNTLKQFVCKLPTNCLSLFVHFVKLALKGLSSRLDEWQLRRVTPAHDIRATSNISYPQNKSNYTYCTIVFTWSREIGFHLTFTGLEFILNHEYILESNTYLVFQLAYSDILKMWMCYKNVVNLENSNGCSHKWLAGILRKYELLFENCWET